MKSGRPPKPADQRVNRNKPTHETVVLAREGRTGRAPVPVCALPDEGLKLWRRLWKTPEATQWGEVDVAGLSRLVFLTSTPEAWLDSKLLAEMRNLEDRYGCNPYGRRLSKWVLEDEPEADTGRRSTVRALRAVDPAVNA